MCILLKFYAHNHGITALKATVPAVLPQQWFPLLR